MQGDARDFPRFSRSLFSLWLCRKLDHKPAHAQRTTAQNATNLSSSTSITMASTSTIKTIVITGSSGYVGQHLIAHLARHGITDNDNDRFKVYCAYNSLPTFPSDLSEFCQNSIDAMHPSIVSMEAFVLDFQSDDNVACTILRACGDAAVDVILHLAALSSPYYCQFHPEEAWRINVPIGLLNLNADIIYMSTDQVYEGTGMFYSEEEDEKTLPVNLYGRTKLAFERVLFMSNRISGGDGTNTDSCENGDDDGLPPPPLLTPQELGDSILPDYLSPQQLIQHYPTTTTKSKSSHVILRSSLILGAPTPFTHGCKKGSSFLQFVQQRLTSYTSTDYYMNE
eukprot:scaffold7595_cov49-Cyclotella_meneghiniana.AAC.4